MNNSSVIYILCVIIQKLNANKISISYADYLELVSSDLSMNFLDFTTDLKTIKNGHYATLLGAKLFIDKGLNSNELKVPLNNKWSIPIRFDQIDDIDRIIKLQVFY